MSLYTKVMDKIHARLNLWNKHGGDHHLQKPLDHLTLEGELKVVIDSIRGLKQELELAENDAIRYREMRRAIVGDNEEFVEIMEEHISALAVDTDLTNESFDACVDAAIVHTAVGKANGQPN